MPKFIPTQPHPGSFGAVRKFDIHTGVDIYFKKDEEKKIYALEDSTYVYNSIFTGPEVMTPWWNTTYALVLKGSSGLHHLYGEISICPFLLQRVSAYSRYHHYYTAKKEESVIRKGTLLGTVIPVLKDHEVRDYIPHHSNYMLHFEMYSEFTSPVMWKLNTPKPKNLLDPTAFLDKNIQYLICPQ